MTQFRSPLTRQARITSTFDHHMSDSRRNFAGIDLVYADGNSFGQPIVATSKQKILSVQDNYTDPSQPKRFGEKYIYTQDYDNPDYTFLYLHNDQNLVVSGDIVDAGFTIATMGFSGWTIPDDSPKGTHLHYEVRVKGKRENPEWTTDFNDWGQTIINPVRDPDKLNVGDTVQPTLAVSYDGIPLDKKVLSREYSVIQVSGERVVLGNGLNTAFRAGDLRKIEVPAPQASLVEPPVVVTPEHQPLTSADIQELQEKIKKLDEKFPESTHATDTDVPSITEPQPILASNEGDTNPIESNKTTNIEHKNEPNQTKNTPESTHPSGRILGVSKKLSSVLAAGLEYLAFFAWVPPEIQSIEVFDASISFWVGLALAILHGLHITVQGIIDYTKEK